MEDEFRSIISVSKCVNIIVSAVIEHDGSYLLIQEAKEKVKGLWSFPRGKVQFGEGLIAAVRREVLEETGYEIRLTGIVNVQFEQWDGGEGVTVAFNFRGEVAGERKTEELAWDVQAIDWKTPAELRQMVQEGAVRLPTTVRLIDEALAGTEYSLEALQEL